MHSIVPFNFLFLVYDVLTHLVGQVRKQKASFLPLLVLFLLSGNVSISYLIYLTTFSHFSRPSSSTRSFMKASLFPLPYITLGYHQVLLLFVCVTLWASQLRVLIMLYCSYLSKRLSPS